MILVDGKELNLSVPKSDTARWDLLTYNERWACEGIQAVRELKEVVLKSQSPINKKKFLKQATEFDLVARRKNPETGVDEKWVFCDNSKTNLKTGAKSYPAKILKIRTEASYTSPELMFFLTNPELRKDLVGFVVENKAQDAKIKNSVRKVDAEVSNWIFNKCTKADIIQLSYRWGLGEIDVKSDDELRDELYETIKSAEAKKDIKKGFQFFIDEMNSNSDVAKVATYFNKAIQDKLIGFNPTNRTCFWQGTAEVIGGIIPPVRFSQDKEEYVIQYLCSNPEEKDLFLMSLAGSADGIALQTGDYMMINNVGKLRKWAKDTMGLSMDIESLDIMKSKITAAMEKANAVAEVTE